MILYRVSLLDDARFIVPLYRELREGRTLLSVDFYRRFQARSWPVLELLTSRNPIPFFLLLTRTHRAFHRNCSETVFYSIAFYSFENASRRSEGKSQRIRTVIFEGLPSSCRKIITVRGYVRLD